MLREFPFHANTASQEIGEADEHSCCGVERALLPLCGVARLGQMLRMARFPPPTRPTHRKQHRSGWLPSQLRAPVQGGASGWGYVTAWSLCCQDANRAAKGSLGRTNYRLHGEDSRRGSIFPQRICLCLPIKNRPFHQKNCSNRRSGLELLSCLLSHSSPSTPLMRSEI